MVSHNQDVKHAAMQMCQIEVSGYDEPTKETYDVVTY